MKKALILLVVAASLSAQILDEPSTRLLLNFHGNKAEPQRLSEKSYKSGDWYGGGRIGLALYSPDQVGMPGFDVFISADADKFKLRGTNNQAEIYNAYFGLDVYWFCIKLGAGLGGLKLSLPDSVFNNLGRTTLTELKSENKYIQFSDFRCIGLKIPMDRVAIDADWTFISADRAFMFWHMLLSDLISVSLFQMTNDLASKLIENEETQLIGGLLIAANIGLQVMWYDINYKYRNWPFRDGPPFRYQRYSFGLDFRI